MFISFLIIPFFHIQYLLDVMRIGVIFGLQSLILFVFVFSNKNTSRRKKIIPKITISIIFALYICLVVCCVVLGYSNVLPYNTDTTVPWSSDSTYIQKTAE